MDLLKDNVRPVFYKYFAAAFGGAFLSCIYGIVDSAVVGWYHGPEGTAAITVVLPVFNLIYALGLLVGQGGSVLLANAKGSGCLIVLLPLMFRADSIWLSIPLTEIFTAIIAAAMIIKYTEKLPADPD